MKNVAERKKYLIATILGTGLFFLGSLIYTISMIFIPNSGVNIANDIYFTSIMQCLSYVPFIVFAIFILKDDFITDFIKLKKNPKSVFITVLWCIGVMFIANFCINSMYGLFGIEGESANENAINEILMSPAALPMIIAVCILAPVTEEILFRKMIFGLCEKTFNIKPIVTIVISTLIFAFIHVTDPESMIYIFQYIPLAALICVCYHKSYNNIYASILLHAANNILGVIAIYISM